MNYLIGIDLGTSSTKTVLFDEKGEVIASASKDYPLYTPHNGWAEQKPEDWFAQSMEGMKELTKDIDRTKVAGIGFGGQSKKPRLTDLRDSRYRRNEAQTDVDVYEYAHRHSGDA